MFWDCHILIDYIFTMNDKALVSLFILFCRCWAWARKTGLSMRGFIFSWSFTASPSSTPSATRCRFYPKYLQFRRRLRNRLRSFEVWFRSNAEKSFLSLIPFISWAHNWNRRHGMFHQKRYFGKTIIETRKYHIFIYLVLFHFLFTTETHHKRWKRYWKPRRWNICKRKNWKDLREAGEGYWNYANKNKEHVKNYHTFFSF